MSKTKGQVLFEDFLDKLGVSLRTHKWEDMTACWEAREKLEIYLNPARDDKGHFKAKS